MTTTTDEADTWAAELEDSSFSSSFDTPDEHFSQEQPVRKVASGGPAEKDAAADAFDGDWDSSNWYWDNDFDCLSVSDDSPTEMISVVICSDDEMMDSVDNGGDGGMEDEEEEEVDESIVALPPLTDEHGAIRDPLSNEEYLMQFERKFSQAADFGGYNISSVSSSLNSSSDSSLYIVTEADRKGNEFRLRQEDRRPDDSQHRSQTMTPSSQADAATGGGDDGAAVVAAELSSVGHRFRAEGDGDGVHDVDPAFVAQHFQSQNRKELWHEFLQTVKDNKEMKRKVRRKTSSSKVSTFSKTEKSAFSQSGDTDRNFAVEQRTRNDSSFDSGYSNNHSTRNNVLAVFSFAASLGLVSGLFLGFLTSQYTTPSANVGDNRKHHEFNCLRRFCQSGHHQMILNAVWATKYEELVMENADLHLKLQEIEEKFSVELFQAQHIVAYLRREVGEISDDFGELERRRRRRSSESAECHLMYANDDRLSPPAWGHSSSFSARPSSSFATPSSLQWELLYRVSTVRPLQSERQSKADLYQLSQTKSSLH